MAPRGRPSLKPKPADPKVVQFDPHALLGDDVDSAVVGLTPVAAVERMAGLGLSPRDIAIILDVDVSLLSTQPYYRHYLLGRTKANMVVANAIHKAAKDEKHPKFAPLAIWWSKVHMGWQEPGGQNENPTREADLRLPREFHDANPHRDENPMTDATSRERFAAMMKRVKAT